MIDISWLGCECCNNKNQKKMLITTSTQTNTTMVKNELSIKENDIYNEIVERMDIQTTPRNRIYL